MNAKLKNKHSDLRIDEMAESVELRRVRGATRNPGHG